MKYIRGFDGLRAVSVIFVITTHVWFPEALPEGSFFKRNFLLISGRTGVMIFFTLSGFLITLLLLEERALKGRVDLTKFFARRFLRLLPPLAVFYCLVTILMLSRQLPPNPVALFASFFYLGNFIPKRYWAGELFHTWSLGVEEQFYLLWPFVIQKFSAWKGLFRTALALVFVSLGFIALIPLLTFHFKGKELYVAAHFYTECWFIPACLPIMLGALGGAATFYRKAVLHHLLRWRFVLPLVILLLYSFVIYTPKTIDAGFILAVQSVGITLFLVWIFFKQGSFVVKILEFRPLRFLGLISYGVYVYQGLFLRTGPSGTLSIQHYPLNLCLTFCLAVTSYYTIEKWSRQYKRRFR